MNATATHKHVHTTHPKWKSHSYTCECGYQTDEHEFWVFHLRTGEVKQPLPGETPIARRDILKAFEDEGAPDDDIDEEENEFEPCENCDLPDACADHGCAIKAGIKTDPTF